MTKQYTNEEIKEQTQAAVKRIFGDSLGFLDFNEPSRNHVYGSSGEQILCESIYTPEEDAGEWSPTSATIINHEHGIPGANNGTLIDAWFEVSDMLPDDYYVEQLNGAISAVYKLR